MKYYLPLLLILSPVAALSAPSLPAPIQQIEKQGIEIIKPIQAPGGLQGWLGKYQDMGVTLYLTPDGQHVISGYMYDSSGKNLSEKLFQDELYTPEGQRMWSVLLKTPAIHEGRTDAPNTLVVFADPFCPYCKTFWQKAQPWITAGKVQMRTLLVGVIKPESGRYAAAILSAANPGNNMNYQTEKRSRPFQQKPIRPSKISFRLTSNSWTTSVQTPHPRFII